MEAVWAHARARSSTIHARWKGLQDEVDAISESGFRSLRAVRDSEEQAYIGYIGRDNWLELLDFDMAYRKKSPDGDDEVGLFGALVTQTSLGSLR